MKVKADQTIKSGIEEINNKIEDRTTFFYYAFRNILLVGLPLVLISALILLHSSSHSSATDSNSDTDTFSVSISSSCTIRSSVDSPHTTEVFNGNYVSDLGNTKVNTFCNDNNGYSIYAIGSSGDIDGNTDLISSLNNNNYNIHTGIYDSSSITASSPSTWSMKLTAGIGTGIDSSSGSSITTTPPTIRNGYDNYSLVPSVYTLVASRDSKTDMSTDTNATGSYFTTTYDIYASSTQQAGTYAGKVKYLMVHPQSNLTTIPDINTAFAISGKMKAYEDSNGSYYAMQDMNSDICSLVGANGESTSAQLVDIRDNKIYWVTKLKDGHCWMTQNLDLAIGSTNTPLTSENTDISTIASGSGIYNAASGYTQNNGVYTWTPDAKAITSNHIISNTSVPDWPNSNTVPYSAEAGDAYYYTSGTTNPETKTTLAQCIANGHTEAECKHYYAGNYYNWTAAIATNDSSDISSNYTQADNSICPKGWRLPIATNGSSNTVFEFGDLLYTAYHITTARAGDQISYTTNGFNNLRKAPLWFVRSGNLYGSILRSPGVYGSYWSSTVNSSDSAYDLLFNSSNVWPSNSGNRYVGWSIRCIAR